MEKKEHIRIFSACRPYYPHALSFCTAEHPGHHAPVPHRIFWQKKILKKFPDIKKTPEKNSHRKIFAHEKW